MLQLAELDLELAFQGGIGTLGEAEPIADGGTVVDSRAADASVPPLSRSAILPCSHSA